jgi:hypothetical protein
MIQLLRALDFDRYTPRTYILSEGDHLSVSKANELEVLKSAVRSCFQPIHPLPITMADGQISRNDDNNPPTCSKSPSTTRRRSFQHSQIFGALSSRNFGQPGVPGRAASGSVTPERAGNMCSSSLCCLFQSGASCISRVPWSRTKSSRNPGSSLVCPHHG